MTRKKTKKKTVAVPLRKRCEDCDGTGVEQMPIEPDEPCEICEGKGYVEEEPDECQDA